MILFTLQLGPHRKISHSEIWKVDDNRIAELGEGSDLELVGDCARIFRMDASNLPLSAERSASAHVNEIPENDPDVTSDSGNLARVHTILLER